MIRTAAMMIGGLLLLLVAYPPHGCAQRRPSQGYSDGTRTPAGPECSARLINRREAEGDSPEGRGEGGAG
jgi:hypothetical protein